MKSIILILMLIGSQAVMAESYLIVDKSSKEVISLSPRQDAQLEQGWEEIILLEDFSDILLTAHPTMYKYKDEKFIKNIDKISDKEIKKEKGKKKTDEMTVIRNRTMLDAMILLESEGVVFKEVEHSDFE